MSIMTEFDPMVMEFFSEYGVAGQYVKTSVTFDANTGEASDTSTSQDVQCIVLDLDLQSNGLGVKPGTTIEAGDKQIFIRPPNKVDSGVSNFSVDPATDKIVVGSDEYHIITFKQANPTMGADPTLFIFYVRK